MNTLFLQYQFGDISDSRLCRIARQSEFQKLLECTAPNYYKYAKGTKNISGVSCLDMDNMGQHLLGSGVDGSVSIWSLDDKLDEMHNGLCCKRLNFRSRSSMIEESSPSKKRAKTVSPSPRIVHSFETRRNKYRMYRQSSDLTKLTDDEEADASASKGHRFGITTLKWYAKDNGMFFTGSNDSKVKLWDTNTFEAVQEINLDYRINQLDTDNDGTYIVVATEDYYPRIIDLKNVLSAGITNLSANKMDSEILCCKINPLKTHIVATGDSQGNVKLWDLRMRNRLLLELSHEESRRAHLKNCNDLCWNSDGTELASIATDGRCYIWTPFTTTIERKQMCSLDLMRNKIKKRVSQRLLRFDDYLLCNTDHGEIQIYETIEGKLYSKIDHPVSQQTNKSTNYFTGMTMQQNIANSRGLRLYLGTSSISNTEIKSAGCVYEYM